MTAPVSPGALAAAGTPPAGGSERERLSGAAKQFEAIFLRQVLAAARSTDFGDDLFGGQGEETFREMRDAQFAQIASESGTLGFAARIEAQLARFVGPKA